MTRSSCSRGREDWLRRRGSPSRHSRNRGASAKGASHGDARSLRRVAHLGQGACARRHRRARRLERRRLLVAGALVSFRFGLRSREMLQGVHPDLILVVSRGLLYSPYDFVITEGVRNLERQAKDRKSTRLNSSHSQISYAVFCLKKKK